VFQKTVKKLTATFVHYKQAKPPIKKAAIGALPPLHVPSLTLFCLRSKASL
jgi:hypothetical protein